MMNKDIGECLKKLQAVIRELAPFAVAVSGGVDSMTLAVIAGRLDKGTRIFHALSPAVPDAATRRVENYAQQEGWHLHLVNAGEMADPDYLSNPVNRCYFCKSRLYDRIRSITNLNIASGTNTDDLSDYRPGLKAASERHIHHPFVTAAIDKKTVRALARHLGLTDLAALPAAPCLSSRISTGIGIQAELLPLVDRVETEIRSLLEAFMHVDSVRCRVRPDHLAIELAADHEIDGHSSQAGCIRKKVSEIFHGSGFEKYCSKIVIEPYRRGSAFIRVREQTLEVNA
ncbi:MAG: ATPase [Pseudomonadales bacterium]|nr:ATPase [Pseudomonadales bacterium]